jgi:hypothetical protein
MNLESLVEDLKSPNTQVRMQACTGLVELGDKRAVPVLIAALKDRHEYVGSYAADALAKLGDPTAIPALEAAVRDRERFMLSCHAGNALQELRNISTHGASARLAPPTAPLRSAWRPPPPPRCSAPPEKQSNVPVIVRCVLIGLTLLGLLFIVHQVKKWTGGDGKGGEGNGENRAGKTGAANSGGTDGSGGETNKPGKGEGSDGDKANTQKSGEHSSGRGKPVLLNPDAGPAEGTNSPVNTPPIFNSGSSREIDNTIRLINKDAASISSWSLYRRINFHCRSIDQVLLTLVKGLRSSDAKYNYTKLKILYDEAGLLPQSGFCARPINVHHSIMAKAALTLAMLHEGKPAVPVDWNRFISEIEDSPQELDDCNTRMMCLTVDCFSKVIIRHNTDEKTTSLINGLQGKWSWRVEEGAPIKALENVCNAFSQIMLAGLQQHGNTTLITEAKQSEAKYRERIRTASDAFERVEISLEMVSKIMQSYARTFVS